MLHDVGHVVNIKFNLILAGRLDDEGYSGGFQNGTWKFCKVSMIVVRAQKQNTLPVTHARLCRGEANVIANIVGELWHKRLSHMS